MELTMQVLAGSDAGGSGVEGGGCGGRPTSLTCVWLQHPADTSASPPPPPFLSFSPFSLLLLAAFSLCSSFILSSEMDHKRRSQSEADRRVSVHGNASGDGEHSFPEASTLPGVPQREGDSQRHLSNFFASLRGRSFEVGGGMGDWVGWGGSQWCVWVHDRQK